MRRLLPPSLTLACVLWLTGPPAAAAQEVPRKDPVKGALSWLSDWAERTLDEPPARRSINESAKESAVLCALSFLFALYEETPLVDPVLRERVADRLRRFARGERAPGEDALESWTQAFCGMALIERAQRGADDGDALAALCARIEAGQLDDGGWGHGFRRALPNYPSTMIAATNGSLLVLGLAERLGLEVDEGVLERGLALYREVRAESGALPYGGPFYRADFEAARTAGALTAMTAVGRSDEELVRCTADYLFVNVQTIPQGHGSPAYHVFEGALAFHVLGPEAWERYREVILGGVAVLPRGDGSFGDFTDDSPDSHEALGPDELNTAYRTVLYAAALSIPRSFLAWQLRESGEDRLPVVVTRHRPNECCLVWERELSSAAHLHAAAGMVVSVNEGGKVSFHEARTGFLLQEREHPAKCELPLEVSGVVQQGDHLIVWTREVRPEDFDEERLAARVFRADFPRAPEKSYFACYSVPEMRLLWNNEHEGAPLDVRLHGDELFVLSRSGGLNVHTLRDGSVIQCFSTPPAVTHGAFAPLGSDDVAVAAETVLQVMNFDGEIWWRERRTARGATTPPSWTALCAVGELLHSGSTDGVVRAHHLVTGELAWQLPLRAAVRELASPAGQPELLLALTDDGRVCAISRGEVLWETDLSGGHEWRGKARWHSDGDRLWIAHEGHGSVRHIDLKSGEITSEFALPQGATWTVADGRLYYAVDRRLFSLE